MSLPSQPHIHTREVELLRDVLGTAAHEVGGLASALALTAETVPNAGGQALATIANELRLLGRQLRYLRGPRGGELLAPTSSNSVAFILALVERFGRSAVGRGVSLVVHSVDQVVPSLQGDAVTHGLLAVLHGLREAGLDRPTTVHITATALDSAHVRVTVRVTAVDGRAVPWPPRQLPWMALAERALAHGHMDVTYGTHDMSVVVACAAP